MKSSNSSQSFPMRRILDLEEQLEESQSSQNHLGSMLCQEVDLKLTSDVGPTTPVTPTSHMSNLSDRLSWTPFALILVGCWRLQATKAAPLMTHPYWAATAAWSATSSSPRDHEAGTRRAPIE